MVAPELRPLVLQGCGSGHLLAWPGLAGAHGHCQGALQPFTGGWGCCSLCSCHREARGGRDVWEQRKKTRLQGIREMLLKYMATYRRNSGCLQLKANLAVDLHRRLSWNLHGWNVGGMGTVRPCRSTLCWLGWGTTVPPMNLTIPLTTAFSLSLSLSLRLSPAASPGCSRPERCRGSNAGPCWDHLGMAFPAPGWTQEMEKGQRPRSDPFHKPRDWWPGCGCIPAPHPQPQQSHKGARGLWSTGTGREPAGTFPSPTSTETDTCVPPLCRAVFSSRNYILSIYV